MGWDGAGDESLSDLGMDLDDEVIDADGFVIFFFAGSKDIVKEVESFEEVVAGTSDISSSSARTDILRLPADTEVNVEVLPSSLMFVVLVVVSTPPILSSTCLPMSSRLLSGAGGAVRIAENAWPPLADVFGIMSCILLKYGQPFVRKGAMTLFDCMKYQFNRIKIKIEILRRTFDALI